jgi:hypothetical protein
MSKRHQASRRRTYGRRQHEMHERMDRPAGDTGWLEDSTLQEAAQHWTLEAADCESGGGWLQVRGIN